MTITKLTSRVAALLRKQGKKRLRQSRYQALVRVAFANGESARVIGPSPGGAAVELGISRQAVHRAIDRGSLDAWYVSESGEEADERCYIYVSEESLARYKKSGRRRAYSLDFSVF